MPLPSGAESPFGTSSVAEDEPSSVVEEMQPGLGTWTTIFIAIASFIAGALATDLTRFKEKPAIAGLESAKWLMRQMDKNRQRRVSKEEFLGFMEEEFKRLDRKKDGLLDVRELSQLVVGSERKLNQRPEGSDKTP
jgi:hypothetical protein